MPQSKELQAAHDQKFIAAFNKYFAKTTKITVNEAQYTPAQITKLVQSRVDAETNVVTTRGNYSRAVAAAKATNGQTESVYEGAKQFVLVTYGTNPAVLSEFGLVARKQPGPKSIATKQAALVQSAATRVARHTMGPRQRAKVKGVVTTASSDAAAAPPATSASTQATAGSNPGLTLMAPASSTAATGSPVVTGH
jgi:hypothetical protein